MAHAIKHSNRRRKLTPGQKEKRAQLLQRILDNWVYVDFGDEDDENNILFLKHQFSKNGGNSIEQIVLSNNFIWNGVYVISDYDLKEVLDIKSDKSVIEFCQRQFEKILGDNAEKNGKASNFEELKEKMIQEGYLTAEEFQKFCSRKNKPSDLEEIILGLDEY